MARLLTICVGRAKEAHWAGIGRTSIDKRPVVGPVRVGELGLAGDSVSDTVHHGGPDQAVYAYGREDLDFWEDELGHEIRDGQFGENITLEGIDLNGLLVGTILGIGDEVVLQVASVRTPCNDFKRWMGLSGYDQTAWVKRFTAERRPGPYLRVLRTGCIAAGDPVHVLHEPTHGISVRDLFVALTVDRTRLPELLVIDGLPPRVSWRVEQYLARGGGPLPTAAGVI